MTSGAVYGSGSNVSMHGNTEFFSNHVGFSGGKLSTRCANISDATVSGTTGKLNSIYSTIAYALSKLVRGGVKQVKLTKYIP